MAKSKKAKKLQVMDLENDTLISEFLRVFSKNPPFTAVTWSEFCERFDLPVDPPHDERYSMASRRLKREVEIMRANGWKAHPELIHGQRVWVRRPLSHEQVLALRGSVQE